MSNATNCQTRPRQVSRRLTGMLAGAVAFMGCSGAPAEPRGAVTYELRAVNGAVLPVTVGVIGDDTLRILGERVLLGANGRAEARRLQQLGSRPATVETTSFVVQSVGDSVRLLFPCPANALCSVPSRIGLRAAGTTLQLREDWLNGLTFAYERVE